MTVITRSAEKAAEAKTTLGVDDAIVTSEEGALQKAANTLDVILDTVSAQHDVRSYLQLLRTDGRLLLVGVAPEPFAVGAFDIVAKRLTIGGSLIGGIAETQELLDFCGEHNITADVELISCAKVNEAYERLLRSDVKYRFVMDIENTINDAPAE